MKIGWVSATPIATTGYGRQTKEACSRLIERHDVVCVGTFGDVIIWGGRHRLPTPCGKELLVLSLSDPRSAADVINAYSRKYRFDVIIGHMDCFGIEFLNNVEKPVIGYIPIDGPFTAKMYHYLRNYHRIVAYSKFGYEQLLKWYPPAKVSYIPHVVNVNVFHPLDRESKEKVRERFEREYGIPRHAFLALNLGANFGERKELPLLMRTFKKFVEEREAYLFMHTNAFAPYPRGYDLIAWRRMLNMEKYIHFPRYNPIIEPATDEELCMIVNAADAYVQNSIAEGLGLPLVEAMACGVSVIAPDNSAQRELVKGRGWLFESVEDDIYVNIPCWIPNLQEYPVPNQRSLLEKLKHAYEFPELRKEYGEKSREFSLNYSPEKVMPQWFRFLEEVKSELQIFREMA